MLPCTIESPSTSDKFNFQIQVEIYHLANSLLPLPSVEHKFLQIYFIGNSKEEVDTRCAIKRAIVQALQEFFREHNALFSMFRVAIR